MMTANIKEVWIFGILSVTLIFLLVKRFTLSRSTSLHTALYYTGRDSWAYSQTTGNQEIQADKIQVVRNSAGIMAVLADGIGKENTGKLCAQIATDTVLDQFEPYKVLNNPDYLFRSSFIEANSRIQKTIGNRRGGACLGAVYTNGTYLYYGLSGNVRITLFRNGELIPLSKGQTMNELAMKAYQEGRLPKRETIWSMDEKQVLNYLGMDGFREIELCKPPVCLRRGDVILMATMGIFDELSWAEMEDALAKDLTLQEKADSLVMAAERKPDGDKDNGTVLLLQAEVLDEKNQF